MLCDGCGIELKGEEGQKPIIAKRFSLLGAQAESRDGKRVKELYGKTIFNFCAVCYLAALGAKKVKE